MLKLSRTVVLLMACAAILPATGCARNRVKSDTTYVARDVSTLYATAKRYMDWGNYEMAAKLFDEVERQHPYSVWARRAQIMSAFNYYLAQKYTDSISSAQRCCTLSAWARARRAASRPRAWAFSSSRSAATG